MGRSLTQIEVTPSHLLGADGDVRTGDRGELGFQSRLPVPGGVGGQDVGSPGAVRAGDFEFGVGAGVTRSQLQLYAEGDPVNRIDPQGTLSMTGVADALGSAGDLAQAGVHLARRETKALWGDVAGTVVGGGIAVACASAVVAAPLTLGSSLGFTVGCYAASWAGSQIAQIPFS